MRAGVRHWKQHLVVGYPQKIELFDLILSLKKRNNFSEALLIRKLLLGETITINPFHTLWIELCNYPFVKQEFQLIGSGAIVKATL